MDWTAIIIQALIMFGAGGVGAALVNGYFNRHTSKAGAQKTQAEADEIADRKITEVYNKMLDSQNERIDRLDKRLTDYENQQKVSDRLISELRAEIERSHTENAEIKTENIMLNAKIRELEAEREEQIRTNRKQGQTMSELRKRIMELEARLNCNDAG